MAIHCTIKPPLEDKKLKTKLKFRLVSSVVFETAIGQNINVYAFTIIVKERKKESLEGKPTKDIMASLFAHSWEYPHNIHS